MAEAAAAQVPAPKPGEVQIDLAKLGGDDMGVAGDALAGLFADEDQPKEIQQEAGGADQPADAEQAETPAIGDTEDGHSEQAETPAIEPPATWTAEEKQLYANLPPEAKAAMAPFLRRESERERLTSTQSQKAAEAAQRLDAERQQVAADRAQQVTLLQSVLFQLTPDLQRFQNVDWNKLAAEKPAEWAQQRQAFDDMQLRWNMAQQQIGRIQETQRVEQEKQNQTYLKGEYDKLVEKVPDFADRAKFRAFGDDVLKYLPEYTKEEISGVGDHRQLLTLRDAMLYRKAVALRAQAQTKRAPVLVKPPLKSVARQGSAREEADARQLGALHETLRKSGTTQAAADMLAATGIFGKN